MSLEGDEFEVVQRFRYLGVWLDERGSAGGIADSLVGVAKGSLAHLCSFVGS